jgi:hypothetical protein
MSARRSKLVSYVAYMNGRRQTVIIGERGDVDGLAAVVLTGDPGAFKLSDEFDTFNAQHRVVIDHGKGGPQ